MPCNTCKTEARCDRAGLCQDHAKQQLQQHVEAPSVAVQWCNECMVNVKKPCSYKDCPVGAKEGGNG